MERARESREVIQPGRMNPGGIASERLFYKISEVSTITGLEAYVLRYWETEFPTLRPQKSRGGQRVYKKKDIETILQIKHQPYVGDSAFAHKGGVHVHAVRKNPLTYEHIRPERVGNRRRVLISDYAGRSLMQEKAKEFNIRLNKRSPKLLDLLNRLKDLENQGYQFEGAEVSFELLMRKAEGTHKQFFDLIGFRVIVEKRKEREDPISEATIMVKVGDHIEHTAAVGDGPVNALDHALRKALYKFYPQLKEMKLLDYKVRVLAANRGTAARVRVLVESGDHSRKWGTVGVSENIIEASWQALVDSIEYKLLKDNKKRLSRGRPGSKSR